MTNSHVIDHSPSEQKVTTKVILRLIPFLLLLYVISYIDRVNISFAALEMNKSLGFNAEVYGLAAGFFFIGYFLFEIPSNILLNKFGAKVWLARILVTWGLMVVLTGFVQNATQMYIVRFCLGLAEAGFFPGIILYMRKWFPTQMLAKIVALFMCGVPVAFVIGSPLSTWLIDNVTAFGYEGWRWMFFIEGALAIIVAPITYFYLSDGIEEAKWLTDEEKQTLILKMDASQKTTSHVSPLIALKDARVWYFALVYFIYISSSLGLIYFMPAMIKQLPNSFTNFQVGLMSALPYLIGGVAMVMWGRHSDRTQERRFHAILPMLLLAAAYFFMAFVAQQSSVYLLLTGLIFALIGTLSFNGPFWSYANQNMSADKAVVGIALINSLGGLGGFSGPYLMGMMKDTYHSTTPAIILMGCCLLINSVLVLLSKKFFAGKK